MILRKSRVAPSKVGASFSNKTVAYETEPKFDNCPGCEVPEHSGLHGLAAGKQRQGR